jgi:hypothetical protein
MRLRRFLMTEPMGTSLVAGRGPERSEQNRGKGLCELTAQFGASSARSGDWRLNRSLNDGSYRGLGDAKRSAKPDRR